MPQVSCSIELPAPVQQAWKRISRFSDASWVKGSKECSVEGTGVGAVRTVTTADGARIREQLLSHDEAQHSFSYAIIEAPMPIRDYVSVVRVEANGPGSRVTWSCTFEAADNLVEPIRNGLEDLFRASLDDLRASLA